MAAVRGYLEQYVIVFNGDQLVSGVSEEHVTLTISSTLDNLFAGRAAGCTGPVTLPIVTRSSPIAPWEMRGSKDANIALVSMDGRLGVSMTFSSMLEINSSRSFSTSSALSASLHVDVDGDDGSDILFQVVCGLCVCVSE